MADEDEVDIEGDFELNLGPDSSVIYDPNEPPSKTVDLQPEYSQHPWMLEQGWSLDHCADEKSKAAIERMLQEEQHLLNGKVSYQVHSSSAEGILSPGRKLTIQKRPWTQEEKDVFFRGLEIYGRHWSRIADLIPSRTVQQVKNFGQQHFKMQARQEEKNTTMSSQTVATSVEEMLKTVTTAQTTVELKTKPQLPRVGKLLRRRKRKQKSTPARRTVSATEHKTRNNSSTSLPMEEVCIMRHSDKDCSSGSDIDIDDDEIVTHCKDHDYGGDEVYKKLVQAAGIPICDADSDSSSSEDSHGLTTGHIVDEYCPVDINDSKTKDLSKTCNEPNSSKFPLVITSGKNRLLVNDMKSELEDQYSDINSFHLHQNAAKTFLLPCGAVDKDSCTPVQIGDCMLGGDPDLMVPTQLQDTHLPNVDTSESLAKNVVDKADSCHSFVANAGECPTSDDMLSKLDSHDADSQVDESMTEESGSQKEHIDECVVYTSNGEAVYLPNPTSEMTMELENISEEERHIHSEFFDLRRGGKTPERYLKIRNYIIDAWLQCKPVYLNKTSVRPGLRSCGDVNCIGRIHAYLEQIGAINFGCAQVQYRRGNKPVTSKVLKTQKRNWDVEPRTDSAIQRKRRVRDVFGDWVDEKDLEGRTIEHKEMIENKTKVPRIRNFQHDPFKLIPCEDFDVEHPAPFSVEIECSALVVMDTHSHLSKTEIIGLLGGQYHEDDRKLCLTMAEPCESLSTGMQCEMDPVSQTEACERIHDQGQNVVGWYHSHPTFDPNPSVRDIETQEKFQDWFARGGSHFVGVIVNPYGYQLSGMESQLRCLIVKKDNITSTNIGVPFQFNFNRTMEVWNTEFLLRQLTDLTRTCAGHSHRVEMLHQFKNLNNILCVDKLLSSLKARLPAMTAAESSHFQDQVRCIITDAFVDEPKQSEVACIT